MDTSKHTVRHFNRAWAISAGFSLVEIALAIGIVSSAVVVTVGFFGPGMDTFRQTMNITVGGQIAQQVISEAQQTDFDALVPPATYPANTTFTKPDRYFDDQGSEIRPATPGAPTAFEKLKIIYWVRTRVSPQTDLPSRGAGNAEITNSTVIATVVVQIANNPSNQPLALETGTANDGSYPLRNLWSGAFQSDTTRKVVSNTCYSTLVSRNQ